MVLRALSAFWASPPEVINFSPATIIIITAIIPTITENMFNTVLITLFNDVPEVESHTPPVVLDKPSQAAFLELSEKAAYAGGDTAIIVKLVNKSTRLSNNPFAFSLLFIVFCSLFISYSLPKTKLTIAWASMAISKPIIAYKTPRRALAAPSASPPEVINFTPDIMRATTANMPTIATIICITLVMIPLGPKSGLSSLLSPLAV